MMIAFLVHGLVVSTWVSRIAAIKLALRLNDGALGLALLGTAVGAVAAVPVSGALVMKIGSRRTARWTGTGFCVSLVLPVLAGGPVTLFAALLIFGFVAGANGVAINAQAVGTEQLMGTPTMSRFHAMFSLGGILGASMGALAAARGLLPLTHLAWGAAVFLVASLATSRLTVDTHDPAKQKRLALSQLPPALLALCAIGFCIFLSEGAIADWAAVFLKQVLRASEGLAATGYAVFSGAMALFRFTGDIITLRIGRAWTIRLGGMVAAAGLLVVVTAQSPYWALGGFALAGAGFSSIIPVTLAAGGRIPAVSAGAGVATVSGLGFLGFLAGPPAIGFISQASSLRVGLFLLVLLTSGAAMLVSVVERAGDQSPLKG